MNTFRIRQKSTHLTGILIYLTILSVFLLPITQGERNIFITRGMAMLPGVFNAIGILFVRIFNPVFELQN